MNQILIGREEVDLACRKILNTDTNYGPQGFCGCSTGAGNMAGGRLRKMGWAPFGGRNFHLIP